MSGLKANLFGRFRVERDGKPLEGIEGNKVKELLSFLLLYRERPQSREEISEILWESQPATKSKKYLRQTLWKLKSKLGDPDKQNTPHLIIEPQWVQLNPSANWWMDIADFERIFNSVKNKPAKELRDEDFLTLQRIIDLYQGDLLEGWYQGWCILERERFEAMYLTLLNKLIQCCELHQQYDAGILYGRKLLCYDRAYESAHRQVMRMYYLAGDRTQALRQYERCIKALQEELGIEPSEPTILLYQQIQMTTRLPSEHRMLLNEEHSPTKRQEMENRVERLKQFSATMTSLQSQIQNEIFTIQNALPPR